MVVSKTPEIVRGNHMPFLMYLPDGAETTDTERFVKVYSEKYFRDYPKNTEEKETEIIGITQKGRDIEADDVITLMRWKTGDYTTQKAIVDCFGRRISFDIGEKVVKAINSDVGQDAMDIYRVLLAQNMSGLGTVYLLTLVWAISGMKYPIYDKYAKVGLSAICKGMKPDKKGYGGPPDKRQIESVRDMYDKYQKQLSEVFGNDWKTRREIDQALWVYGHQKL